MGWQTRNQSFWALEICFKSDGVEGRIITCTAAGTAKVVLSATEDLRPEVGEGVSDLSVVSGAPICNLSGMAGWALL